MVLALSAQAAAAPCFSSRSSIARGNQVAAAIQPLRSQQQQSSRWGLNASRRAGVVRVAAMAASAAQTRSVSGTMAELKAQGK